MDTSIFHAINGLAGHADGVDDLLEAISRFAPMALIGMLLALWFWPATRSVRDARQWTCIAATAAASLALALNQVIIRLWDRPRPFEAHHAVMLLSPSHDPSFPSDHTTFAFAVAVAILLGSRRAGFVAMAIAGLIAFSRVYTGEHYPGDVLAGAVVGSLAAIAINSLRPAVTPLIESPLRLARRLRLA